MTRTACMTQRWVRPLPVCAFLPLSTPPFHSNCALTTPLSTFQGYKGLLRLGQHFIVGMPHAAYSYAPRTAIPVPYPVAAEVPGLLCEAVSGSCRGTVVEGCAAVGHTALCAGGNWYKADEPWGAYLQGEGNPKVLPHSRELQVLGQGRPDSNHEGWGRTALLLRGRGNQGQGCSEH